MKGILLLILILFAFLPEIALSESWYGYVKTEGETWSIYRQSSNISFKSDQGIEGRIEAFEGPRGRILSPFCSYFEDMDLNEVRLKERTAALEGNYTSFQVLEAKSQVKLPIGLKIAKLNGSDVYMIDFLEEWPAHISAYRSLDYSGKGINDRDFSGNNVDFVETNLLYNRELSKELNTEISLERMNATVYATDYDIIRTERKATRNLDLRLLTHTTGIADIKYQQSGNEFRSVPVTDRDIINRGEERYYGSFNMTKNIRMRSRFDDTWQDDDWLPCCYEGWIDVSSFDKKGHSAQGIFDCTCSSTEGVKS